MGLAKFISRSEVVFTSLLFIGLYLIMCVFVTSIQAFDFNESDAQQIELIYWQSIKDSKDSRMYKAYLDSYPEGAFASEAKVFYQKYKTIENSIITSRPGYSVALFRWELEGTAGNLRTTIQNRTSMAIASWPGMVLTASYYKRDKGHSVTWLESDDVYMSHKDEIWQKSGPDIDNIVRIGKKLDVDAVLVGRVRAKNKLTDQYNLRDLKTWMVDIKTGRFIHESNKATMTEPREELIKIIDTTVENFWNEIISKNTP